MAMHNSHIWYLDTEQVAFTHSMSKLNKWQCKRKPQNPKNRKITLTSLGIPPGGGGGNRTGHLSLNPPLRSYL